LPTDAVTATSIVCFTDAPIRERSKPLGLYGVAPVDRSQPEGVSSKTTAAATSADDQSWSAAPWHQPILPTRCFSGLSTVTDITP